ncbi:hypothetical protein CIHG_08665 [Coccidioides immitis H538.4]|uniref:Uncharacterized protein n=1 Tax=Coccidioides immitis H538.4 TaxID=396776 RepID=A0A0J8RZW1_COCIT|nr:hypothetical protein CIHG_08665 [Coccidioides immitis H538.4]
MRAAGVGNGRERNEAGAGRTMRFAAGLARWISSNPRDNTGRKPNTVSRQNCEIFVPTSTTAVLQLVELVRAEPGSVTGPSAPAGEIQIIVIFVTMKLPLTAPPSWIVLAAEEACRLRPVVGG